MAVFDLSTSRKIIKVRGLPNRPVFSGPLTHQAEVDLSTFLETFEGQDWDQIIVPSIDFSTPTTSFGPEAFEAGTGWDKLEEPAEPFDFTTASGFIENFSGW